MELPAHLPLLPDIKQVPFVVGFWIFLVSTVLFFTCGVYSYFMSSYFGKCMRWTCYGVLLVASAAFWVCVVVVAITVSPSWVQESLGSSPSVLLLFRAVPYDVAWKMLGTVPFLLAIWGVLFLVGYCGRIIMPLLAATSAVLGIFAIVWIVVVVCTNADEQNKWYRLAVAAPKDYDVPICIGLLNTSIGAGEIDVLTAQLLREHLQRLEGSTISFATTAAHCRNYIHQTQFYLLQASFAAIITVAILLMTSLIRCCTSSSTVKEKQE